MLSFPPHTALAIDNRTSRVFGGVPPEPDVAGAVSSAFAWPMIFTFSESKVEISAAVRVLHCIAGRGGGGTGEGDGTAPQPGIVERQPVLTS